jgi:putative CRISPR-associated protein (TIGR02619 family)
VFRYNDDKDKTAMRIIICTAGTSIGGGPSRAAPSDEYRQVVRERIEKLDAEGDQQFPVRVSAELNSLREMGANQDDRIVLLHTDTEDGRVCAEENGILCRRVFGADTSIRPVAGLQVDDSSRFRNEGIANLFRIVEEIFLPYLGVRPSPVILNVTGGYKSVVPYLTLYGLMRNLPVVYLFERSDSLLTLPPAPVTFDLDLLSRARVAIEALRRREVMKIDDFLALIPGVEYGNCEYFATLVEEVDGVICMSAFGEMLFPVIDGGLCEVYWSREARSSYERSSSSVRDQFAFMLQRVGDPLWQRQKIHPVSGTDLKVFKPGNTSERMLAYTRKRRVYVCELAQHAEYERLIGSRGVKDYPESEFVRWTLPKDARKECTSELDLVESLRARVEAAEAFRSDSEEHRQQAEAAARKVRGENARLVQAVKEGEKRAAELGQAQRLLSEYVARVEEAEAFRSDSEEHRQQAEAAARKVRGENARLVQAVNEGEKRATELGQGQRLLSASVAELRRELAERERELAWHRLPWWRRLAGRRS